MAVSFCSISLSPLSLPTYCAPLPSLRRFETRTQIISASSISSSPASSHMDLHGQKFFEFPFVSAPHRDMMVDLVSTVENRLGSQLLPCTLPPEAQHCQNETGTAQASLRIRSGQEPSLLLICWIFDPMLRQVDFILGSWLHCKLPTGAALNITSLLAYLNPSTDAPNFVVELIQSGPTSLIFLLDLPPRKDLVLYPDYLQTFYENTQLDARRQALGKLPEVQPYVLSSLYLRHYFSPTAILIRIDAEIGGPGRLEDIIQSHLSPIAKEVLAIWLDHCAFVGREVGEEETACLKKRDQLMKSKSIEIDLGANFPRLFGPEVAGRVLGAIRKVYDT